VIREVIARRQAAFSRQPAADAHGGYRRFRQGKMIRVLIVDDHRLIRDGYRAFLEHEKDMTVVGEAADGWQAVEMVPFRKPDVILMDVAMPGLSGLNAAEQILARDPSARILFVSMTTEDAVIRETRRVGGRGFISKQDGYRELIAGIRAVYAGQMYFSGGASSPA
jgi:DNA-binding NarL/FixJ family response regulator